MPSGQSFTLPDRHTPQSARAAGIPIIDGCQRPLSPRSSSDSSDQELRKIHADHRAKEMNREPVSTFFLNNGSAAGEPAAEATVQRPHSLHVPKPIKVQAGVSKPSTSFTQQRRENGGDSRAGSTSSSLVEQYRKTKMTAAPTEEKVAKKTTFGVMPNQTTWQESAKKTENSTTSGSEKEGDNVRVSAIWDFKN